MRQKFERVAVLVGLIASPFWLPALPSRVQEELRMTWLDWMRPAFQGVQAMHSGFRSLFLGILKGPILLEENRTLQGRLATALAHEQTHRELFEENRRLRALLDFKKQADWPLTAVEVIGHERGPWSRTLLLDKGTRDGIRVGMAVMTPVGLVGQISEVGPALSRAILVTDPHFRVAATASGRRVQGLVMGTSSGECLLTYLPLDADLPPGEMVLTTGGQSFAPRGIPIGSVDKIRPDALGLFRSARIRPHVALDALEEVLVVRAP
jgi:rod shape-determining protein MreC